MGSSRAPRAFRARRHMVTEEWRRAEHATARADWSAEVYPRQVCGRTLREPPRFADTLHGSRPARNGRQRRWTGRSQSGARRNSLPSSCNSDRSNGIRRLREQPARSSRAAMRGRPLTMTSAKIIYILVMNYIRVLDRLIHPGTHCLLADRRCRRRWRKFRTAARKRRRAMTASPSVEQRVSTTMFLSIGKKLRHALQPPRFPTSPVFVGASCTRFAVPEGSEGDRI